MKKKVKLADVLWEAANERLWDGDGDYDAAPYGCWRFSCDAVGAHQGSVVREATSRLLLACGLPRDGADRFDLFDAFDEGKERQGVRYMWLLLAMHVAQDEGIVIEVEQ